MPFVYNPGIPTGTVNLDIDYLNIQGNFQQANIVYGTDHYPFDNATPNQGFHNVVTTPIYVNNPVTGLPPVTTTNPKFYAFQQYAALGVLQYSRGPNNAIPSPLTNINGGPISVTNGAPVNLIDFVGITRAICVLYGFSDVASSTKFAFDSLITFSQGTFNIINLGGSGAGKLVAQASGTNLALAYTSAGTVNNIYWTLQFKRIE